MNKSVNSKNFRQIMGCFTTGIAVATAHNEILGNFGLTINSLASVSLDPPLLLFCLDKSAHLYKSFRQTKIFSINFLTEEQRGISRWFANSRDNPMPKNLWGERYHACPILRGTLGWVVCRPYRLYNGGDHTIVVGEVIALRKYPGNLQPLLYFCGSYRHLRAEKVTSGKRK